MFRVAIPIVLFFAIAEGHEPSDNALILYQWSYSGKLHGTIRVPPGYSAETYNYREGIVTHLRYPDSSCIILQHGGMYTVPMLYQAQYVVANKENRDDRMLRIGSIGRTDRFWREDNLKPRKAQGDQLVSFFDVFPPNIAYEQVPKGRIDLFNQSLDSFVWGNGGIPHK
jgi:hypothetical protein